MSKGLTAAITQLNLNDALRAASFYVITDLNRSIGETRASTKTNGDSDKDSTFPTCEGGEVEAGKGFKQGESKNALGAR